MMVVMMLVGVVAVAVESLVRVAVGVVLDAVGHCECVAGNIRYQMVEEG